MAETEYGQYIIREPLEKGADPSLHICADYFDILKRRQ